MARRSRIQGRSKLRKKLSVILPSEIKKEMQDTVKKAAEVIYQAAERNIPVDSGDLKKSLKLQHRGDKLGAKVGFWRRGNLRNWRRAGWRSHFVEFGTRKKAARPFLGPAYLQNQHRVKNMIDHGVSRALKKVANGNFT